jgi:hypothetical protein
MRKRYNALAEAHATNRDLRNQLHQLEQPLRERIRQLEVERDRFAALAREGADRTRELEKGVEAALGLVRWLLSSGKAN